MIGHTPTVIFDKAYQDGDIGIFDYSVSGDHCSLHIELPPGAIIQKEQGAYFLMLEGKRAWPNQKMIGMLLSEKCGGLDFNVLYVGKAFGKMGSRNALNRLSKHETLQQAAIQGVPEGRMLSILLIEVMAETQLITCFNPFAKEKDESGKRIDMGIDKLYGTTEAERIALYEASFIRYFQPKYNKIFKESFPSTDMKTLANCYAKDILSVSAEFNFDDFPYLLCSDEIAKNNYHIAYHDLHNEEDRKSFFFGDAHAVIS